MTTTVGSTRSAPTRHCLPFAELDSPGTYIANETGELFRIPADALASERSPNIDIVSKTPTLLTKISNDPWVPISRARQIAADADLNISF